MSLQYRSAATGLILGLILCTGLARGQDRQAAPPPFARGGGVGSNDFVAQRLLRKAQDLLLAQDYERGVKMLQTILEQYPESKVRYDVYLTLGQHYLDRHEQAQAIKYLNHLKELKQPDTELKGEDLDKYLQSLYLTGVAYFQIQQYRKAFPVLRRITSEYPNTVWANQAYYYIGMCHFMQKNWAKAIKALGLVGTFVDGSSPTVQFVEAGRRFYVKVQDADLPVQYRLNQQNPESRRELKVVVSSSSGDQEEAMLVPLSDKDGIFIASVATDVGVGKPADGVLHVIGGDSLTVRYTDANTKTGEADLLRQQQVKVVSTGAVKFTLGTFESSAQAAYIGQKLFVTVHDADRDTDDNRNQVMVKVISRFRKEEDENRDATDLTELNEEDAYQVRDEVTVSLDELGEANGPIHSGKFGGYTRIVRYVSGQAVDRNDNQLTADTGDQIVATYVDELHIQGDMPKDLRAMTTVLGEIDSRPRVTQSVVSDPVRRAEKNIIEGTASLELARIFQGMGLRDGANEKAAEGLERVDDIIATTDPISMELRQQAFKLKWELHMVQEDYDKAIATCQIFGKMFPDSPFVDKALMGVAKIHMEQEHLEDAVKVFRQVLALPNSHAKPEAQFMIAQTVEKMAEIEARKSGKKAEVSETAIRAYKECADKYPDSPYAGDALAKLVDFYIESKDFSRASDLLEQIFQDHPDAPWLDKMLLKWVVLLYRMGNYPVSLEKCNQLLMEYPASPMAKIAKRLQPKIEAKVNAGGGE